MKIYFFQPKIETEKTKALCQRVIKVLERAKVTIFPSKKDQKAKEELRQASEILIANIDGFIIEVSTKDPEISYFLAFALLQKKPTLCLFQKGTSPYIPQYLLEQKEVAKFLQVKSYFDRSLEKIILQYLGFAQKDRAKSELPQIKFTLRITPKIEQYLHWKSIKRKASKAEYLRENLEGIIIKDQEYQNYLKQKGG